MFWRLWLAGLPLLCAGLVGCEKPRTASAPAGTFAATRPADDLPLPETRPSTSSLLIGGQLLSFPRARVLVEQKEPNVVLLLFSDDPRDAIDARYQGNRYYFELKLDIDDLAQLPSAEWRYKARSMERVDAPSGIFLDGDRRQLQPHDVAITFSQNGPALNVEIQGQFLLFQSQREDAAPQPVMVQGSLAADLKSKAR